MKTMKMCVHRKVNLCQKRKRKQEQKEMETDFNYTF